MSISMQQFSLQRSTLALSLVATFLGFPRNAWAADLPFFTPPAGETATYLHLSTSETYALFCTAALDGTGPRTLHAVAIPTGSAHALFQAVNLTCNNFDVITNQGDTYALFPAQAPGATGVELWQVDLSGGRPPRSLSGPLPVGMTISSFNPSPDGRWITYMVAPVPTGMNYFERTQGMYLIASESPAPARAIPVIPASSNVYVIYGRFTPDSQTVIYMTDQYSGHYNWDVAAVSVADGAVPRRLSPVSCGYIDLSGCFGPFTADSQYTFMNHATSANGLAEGVYRLSVYAGTPTGVRLSGSADLSSMKLMDHDRYLVTRHLSTQPDNIAIMPVNGSQAAHLVLDPVPAGISGADRPTMISCGDNCLVFAVKGGMYDQTIGVWRGSLDAATSPTPLFTVSAETLGPWAGQILDSIIDIQAAPDGSRVIVTVKDSVSSTLDLYAIPSSGGAATHLGAWPNVMNAYMALTPLLGNRHVALIDSPDSSAPPPHQLVRLSVEDVDGPRTPLSTLTVNNVAAVARQRYILVAETDEYYLLDALQDVFDDLYPHTLNLPGVLK